jgi:hypothetical protein
VTIGIAAITFPDGYIVAATDTRVSFNGQFPADERGIRKMVQITDDGTWNMMLAGPISHCETVHDRIKSEIGSKEGVPFSEVIDVAEKAYSCVLCEVWAKTHIVQFGYSDVSDFIDRGLANLGERNYDRLVKSLYEFDLGVKLVIFGYSNNKKPMLSCVRNPGRSEDLTSQGYAVVGSGTDMALGALRTRDLEDTIYRLLEAKFSSETARHSGRHDQSRRHASCGSVGNHGPSRRHRLGANPCRSSSQG